MASKIILGTVQFGLEYGINNHSGKPDENTVDAILDLAHENGINLLDTAEAYGNSQELIGRYHHKTGRRFEVITKFAGGRTDLPASLKNRVELDLAALETDSLFGYMFHSYKDFETHYKKYQQEILDLKSKGLIKKFGVSIYTNAEFSALLNTNEVDFIQLPFNLLDNDFQRGELIRAAKQRGIEIHTRSVFLQGLFFKQKDKVPAALTSLLPYLGELNQLSEEYDTDLHDMALNYAMAQQSIDHVLIGVDTAEQLKKNIDASGHPVNGALLERINGLKVKETELLNPTNWTR